LADKDIHESCPCCRHEATEHEGLPEADCGNHDEESEESEDSESESESEYEDEGMDRRINAWELFHNMQNSVSQTAFKDYAATRIQAAWRAYLPRMAWVKHKMNVEERKDTTELVKKFQKEEATLMRQEKFHMLKMTSSRAEWRNISASMVQRAWRGYSARAESLKKAVASGYKITWKFKGDHWQRSFLGNHETWYPNEGLPPQSLEFQNHLLWTKVQAAWRAYRIRKALGEHDGKGSVQFTLPILNAVLQHLGGKHLSHKEFRHVPPLNREAFRDLCVLNAARNPTEIEWRQAANACDWIPARLEEEVISASSNELSTFVPRVKYSGLVGGWTLTMQFCRKKRVNPAAKKIQMFWRGLASRNYS
jgi:hypothetical protein